MAEDTAPATTPVAGEVAALAAEAVTTSAEAAAEVQHIAEESAAAVAAVEDKVEDEIAWLTERFQTQQTMLTAIAETLANLPGTIAAAISGEFQSLHRTLSAERTPQAEPESENKEVTQENPVAAVTEAVAETVPKPKGLKFL